MKFFDKNKHPSVTLVQFSGLALMFGGMAVGHYMANNAIAGFFIGLALFLCIMIGMASKGYSNKTWEGEGNEEH